MSFYDHDLAHVHDVGFTHFAEQAAPGVIQLLRDHDIRSGQILELGCGSGVLARRLLDEGYSVTGIDVSSAMLDMARTRAPEARYVNASFHDADLPSCRAVLSIGECLNYLNAAPDHANTLESLVRRVHGALEPGGLLIFDVALPGRAGPAGVRQFNRVGDDWAVLSESTEDGAMLTRRITAFVRDDAGRYRRSEETHQLRLIPSDEILRTLDAAGFDARPLAPYAGMAFPDAYAAFIGVRRSTVARTSS
jgi:SAM-dependent methyltransferase